MVQSVFGMASRAEPEGFFLQKVGLITSVRRVAAEAFARDRMGRGGIFNLGLFILVTVVADIGNAFLHDNGVLFRRPAVARTAFLHLGRAMEIRCREFRLMARGTIGGHGRAAACTG